MSWHVYILKCADNTLYTGITNHLQERIKTHNQKKGAKYTKGRTPVKLIYHELHPDRSHASSREATIKKLNLSQKLDLINTSSSPNK